MISERLPVLAEGKSNLDWVDVEYTVDVKIRDAQATVVHRIQEAPPLAELVENGQAEWVTEFRCPRTLFSHEYRSKDITQRVSWEDADVIGETFLVPGLVAVGNVELDAASLNPFVWPEGTKVNVPAGWWLARGEARRVKPLVSSLIKIRRDQRLPEGQMSAEEDNDGGAPCFVVRMAPNLFDSRGHERDIQVAGLIAACARLPRSTMSEGNENEDHTLAQLLRERFEASGIEDWDSESFDPARAATCLERFYVIQAEDDE